MDFRNKHKLKVWKGDLCFEKEKYQNDQESLELVTISEFAFGRCIFNPEKI